MIDIDTMIEIWVAESRARRAEAVLKSMRARHAVSEHGNELAWWHEACRLLRPDAESSDNDAPGSSP